MQYFIIDGIGPFFRHAPPGRINWSKIPFQAIEKDERLDPEKLAAIYRDFETVCRTASAWGFNTITLDDLAHLYISPVYDQRLTDKLSDYALMYQSLIKIAIGYGLKVWFTTDIMFFTREEGRVQNRTNLASALDTLVAALDWVLPRYPEIEGIIFRIGESDGHDVTGDFVSRIVVKTPRQGRQLMERLMPLFERHGRLLIFRTWSVGAFRIGDLIWNRETHEALFHGLSSDRLLISIKYGESDFFRYLQLNPQFAKSGHKKIIELQARREYEGFGEFPSFIGGDYERYRNQIRDFPDVVGMSVWCQTGGWSAFRRLTFLDPQAVWNEINTWTCIRLFRDHYSKEGAVRSYALMFGKSVRWDKLLELLELSEKVITSLWYLDDFAKRRIYFRRLRIPPLLAVYWDHLFINGALRKILRCFVFDGEAKIRQGMQALSDIQTMKRLAGEMEWPTEDFDFMYDTMALLAESRLYYFRPVENDTLARLLRLAKNYQERYGSRAYRIHVDTRPWWVSRRHLKRVFAVLFRESRRYRWLDRIFTLRLLALIYGLTRFFHRRVVPEFAQKQAMGIDTIFK